MDNRDGRTPLPAHDATCPLHDTTRMPWQRTDLWRPLLAQVIYIAPLKALVRERVDDWGRGMCRALGKKMVELTGDYTPDMRALLAADLIVCTPEKWDGISRNWQTRQYVRRVGLLVIDEIHLLGQDRGPILEVRAARIRIPHP